MHHALNGVGLLRAVELLLVRLAAPDHGHGQHILHEVRVDVQHPHGLLAGLLFGGVHGMALLPQELPVAQEGAAGLFPAQDRAPLVVQLGQVPVGVDNVFIVLTEQGLRGGTDAVALLQLLAAAVGDPGALRGKALHMVLLLLEQGLGDQHGQIHVLVAGLLEPTVHLPLDVLPDGIAIGAVDEHALDGGVVDQLRLLAHVGVPLGEVHLHVGDLLHLLLLVIGHSRSVLYHQTKNWRGPAGPGIRSMCPIHFINRTGKSQGKQAVWEAQTRGILYPQPRRGSGPGRLRRGETGPFPCAWADFVLQ